MTHSFPHTIITRITILVLLLAVIVGIKVYVTRDMNVILRDIRAHYTQTAEIRSARDASVSLLSSFTTIKGNESRIRAALPTADYIVSFHDAIEDAAARTSAKITANYSNPIVTELSLPARAFSTSSEQIYRIATSFVVEGDARALEQFLTELEALPYYFTITAMKSTSAQTDGWEAGARTTITGVLYATHEI